MKFIRNVSFLVLHAVALLAVACITNDLPYPRIPVEVLAVVGEGFAVGPNDIDARNRVVTLRLDETTDISHVRITDVRITENGRAEQPLTGEFDLRNPRMVTLSLYQDYVWEFRAEQHIERIFTVEGQIGATEIDEAQQVATVHVSSRVELDKIRVTQLKLGPRGITTMSPSPEELTDFTSVRYVYVSYHAFSERWKLYVIPTEESVALADVDLWRNTATLSIAALDGMPEKVELNYRRAGASAWQRATVSPVEGGGYSAAIAPTWSTTTDDNGQTLHVVDPATGVFASCVYEYRLVVDGSLRDEGTFETPAGMTIPNGSMNNAALSCFTTKNEAAIDWASGNNSFAQALCTFGSFAGMEGSGCAKLAGRTAAGVLAAGNIFTGIFYKSNLTTGVVEFGQPYAWTARPTSLRVRYYAEKIGTVDVDMHDGAPIGAGDQDRARIFVAIVDWNVRHKVSSGTSAPTGTWDPMQGPDGSPAGKVIGYGSLFIDRSSEGGAMIDAEIPIRYYDREAKPEGTYTLVISCSTSAYGDYMVGCKSNVLYVDDFRWGY